MSSGRESVGDLIPPDVLQVFFEERQGGRGKRARRRALSRAFKWLKRQRRKARKAAEIRGDLLAPGSPVEIPASAPNTESDAGSHVLQDVQENVFVEGNRSKYLLELHIEAQEGLKLLQQEDNKNGIDYPDDQSMISTVTTRTEDSMTFSELRGFESESTAADTISTRSTISSRSTRSGLKRQASTFRPLKPDKSQEKTKSYRKHVKTVMGIPRHVQRELGLDRAAWITTSDDQVPNGAVVLPTIVTTVVDGVYTSSERDRIPRHLQDVKNLHKGLPKDESLLQTLLNVPIDLERSGTGQVSSLNASENAVMSISPQATYMSTVIRNAVLPPSVDVVELSRSRSRSSVRTVSKSSLVSASPASTRASSRVSSHRSTVRSNFSAWSQSDSSETLVSDSSTVSSSSTPRVASRASQLENPNKQDKTKMKVNGHTTDGKTESADAVTRSLSVVKRSKRPPAPPSRSYSLHSKKQMLNGSPSPSMHSRIISPYSSHSNENGPTTYPSKQIQINETSKVNSPHSYTNGTSKLAELKKSLLSAKGLMNGKTHSPAVMALWSLFDVPDHPKVLAPPAPPPETWAHNQRTFELLCGPGPVNYACWAKKRGLKMDVDVTETVPPPPATHWWQIKPPDSVPPPPPDNVPPSPAPAVVWCQTKSPPDTVDRSLSPAAQIVNHLTDCIPPHPLFPPPAPPVSPASTSPVVVRKDTVIPPSPAFSIQTMPKLSQDIPPPPAQQVPPPPLPPQEISPPPPPPPVPPPPPTPPPAPKKTPPQESKPSTHDILLSASRQTDIPPPPPLPTDLKSEVRSVLAEKEEKRSSSPLAAKEDSSPPMITQTLLQMVRLRSVKSNQSQVVDPSQPPQKLAVSQDAPPKPARRSLIMTSLPLDLESVLELKYDAPSPSTEPESSAEPSEPKTQSINVDQKTQNMILEPTCSLDTETLNEPNNPSSAEPELKPESPVEQIQPTASEPKPKDQPITSEPKTQKEASVTQAITNKTPPKPESEQPKTQTSPPITSPPANPSMRLQDAIRLKTAAISSKDNQPKCFGLLSPPPVTTNAAPISPASTASFIFSKSTKKVVIETATSPAVQADLRRTLVAQLSSVSDSSKSNDSYKTAFRVPPPVAVKPKAKVESSAENERGHV